MKKTATKNKNADRAMGACLSQIDPRAIMISRVQAPVKRPAQYYFDDSKIPTENQMANGSCVGQAEGGEVECRELKDTKIVTPVSKRWLYGQCKKVDGFSGEGTFPTIAADIKVKKGVPKKDFCPDDNTLIHSEYIKLPADSAEIKEDAAIRVAAGYAYVPANLEDILQAIFQNGTYTATMQCGDWGTMPVKPTPSRGNHRIRFNGYREIPGDAIIFFRNSWGPAWAAARPGFELTAEEKERVARGDGFFLFSEYHNFIFEQIAYTDIPYAMIMEARNKKYVFTRDLEYKMSGTDVMELQKFLVKQAAVDGLPCFRYPSATSQTFTTYFGIQTRAAVERYQVKNGIAKKGNAGFGRFGPKTRAFANGPAGAAAPLASVGRKIVINAGHDNSDPGAVTLREADETKLIRDQAVIALRSAGFDVYAVPDDLDLKKSIAYANGILKNLNDGLCIDIHLNANSSKSASGVEAYYGTSATSKVIAAALSKNVAASLGLKDRGAKPDTATHVGSLGWVRQTKAWATLVETAFITNSADMIALRTPAGYQKAGQGIANAVMELYGVTPPPPVPPAKPTLDDAKKMIKGGLDILNTL